MTEPLKSGLSKRVINELEKNGITTKDQLEKMSEIDILRIPSFGKKSLDEINAFIGRESGSSKYRIQQAKRLLEQFGYRVEKL